MRMRRVLKAMLVQAAVALTASCTFVLGLEGDVEELPTGAGGNGSGGAGPTTGPGGAGGNGAGAAGGGGGCSGESCAPVAVDSNEAGPDSLVVYGGNLYWIADDPDASLLRVIRRASTEGQGDIAETLFPNATGFTQITLCGPLNGVDTKLCGSAGQEVKAGNIDGTGSMTALDGPISKADRIAADANNLFWIDIGSSEVRRAPLNGGASVEITTQAVATALRDIIADDTGVYWIDGASLLKAPAGQDMGEPIEESSTFNRLKIALGGDTVCWTQQASPGIYCMPKAGGTENDVIQVASAGEPSALAVDADGGFAYWIDDAKIWRAPIPDVDNEMPGELLANSGDGATSIAVDNTRVYWTNSTNVMRIGKPM